MVARLLCYVVYMSRLDRLDEDWLVADLLFTERLVRSDTRVHVYGQHRPMVK